jgi:predicted nucleic acid-binding protein
MKKKSLIDASSAILLYKANLLRELTYLYQVYATSSVVHELTAEDHAGAEMFLHGFANDKFKIIDIEGIAVNSKKPLLPIDSLDKGESDTIKCFQAGKGDLIITDDGRAARYCTENGLPFINALLVPRLLYFADYFSLQESCDKMDDVIDLGRYSAAIIKWARNCLRQDLAFAMP